MNILAELNQRKVNYQQIRDTCYVSLVKDTPVFISVIIPVFERTHFNNITTNHFKKAIDHMIEMEKRNNISPFRRITRISLTIVEHSDTPQHKELCQDWVNYIWIPKNGTRFNKCLAHNMGVLYSNKADYYLFHDLDTLVPKNFFVNLMLNIKGLDAVQSFARRRLLYATKMLTDSIMDGETDVNKLHHNYPNLSEGTEGAKGGSIFMSSKIFFEVGGYDMEFYDGYSVEDAAMYHKLDFKGKLGGCNTPPIELIHLWHPYSHGGNITQPEAFAALHAFDNLSDEDKLKYMQIKSEHLKQYAI